MKNIVLCGSMKVKSVILEVAEMLEEMGYNVLLPEECMKNAPKRIASKAHFNRIADPKNEIVLIVNASKNGIDNYVGPNSFAEVALGFYFNKRIYLLNNIYEPYEDELLAWGAIPLKGKLDKLKL